MTQGKETQCLAYSRGQQRFAGKHIAHNIPVAEHHALGITGCSRRIDERQQVVGMNVGSPIPRLLLALNSDRFPGWDSIFDVETVHHTNSRKALLLAPYS